MLQFWISVILKGIAKSQCQYNQQEEMEDITFTLYPTLLKTLIYGKNLSGCDILWDYLYSYIES